MNKHNISLGNSSTNGSALNTDTYTNKSLSKSPRKFRSSATALAARLGGLEAMRTNLQMIQNQMEEGIAQGRRPSAKLLQVLESWVQTYETSVKASIGMPTTSESVTTQTEAGPDIPTLPIDSFQLIRRTCYIEKIANAGTTAGGFYAELKSNDLNVFLGTNKSFRINKVTSWTVARGDNQGNATFAGVSVPAVNGSAESDSIMPIWSENRTPVGIGFAGIVTHYPLGDFPLYTGTNQSLILTHFTALGGTGGIAGMPVVFHVVIDCLI